MDVADTGSVYVGQEIQQELNDPTRSVGPSHAQNMLGFFCLFGFSLGGGSNN